MPEKIVKVAPNVTLVVAPPREEIENGLRLGLRSIGRWSIWRCCRCHGPAAGGLACPNCGGRYEDVSPHFPKNR